MAKPPEGQAGGGRARAESRGGKGCATGLRAPPRAVWVYVGRWRGRRHRRRHSRGARWWDVPHFAWSGDGQRCAVWTRTPSRAVGVDRGGWRRCWDHARGAGGGDVFRLSGGIGPARRRHIVCLPRGHGPAPRLCRGPRVGCPWAGFRCLVTQIARGTTRRPCEGRRGNVSRRPGFRTRGRRRMRMHQRDDRRFARIWIESALLVHGRTVHGASHGRYRSLHGRH